MDWSQAVAARGPPTGQTSGRPRRTHAAGSRIRLNRALLLRLSCALTERCEWAARPESEYPEPACQQQQQQFASILQHDNTQSTAPRSPNTAVGNSEINANWTTSSDTTTETVLKSAPKATESETSTETATELAEALASNEASCSFDNDHNEPENVVRRPIGKLATINTTNCSTISARNAETKKPLDSVVEVASFASNSLLVDCQSKSSSSSSLLLPSFSNGGDSDNIDNQIRKLNITANESAATDEINIKTDDTTLRIHADRIGSLPVFLGHIWAPTTGDSCRGSSARQDNTFDRSKCSCGSAGKSYSNICSTTRQHSKSLSSLSAINYFSIYTKKNWVRRGKCNVNCSASGKRQARFSKLATRCGRQSRRRNTNQGHKRTSCSKKLTRDRSSSSSIKISSQNNSKITANINNTGNKITVTKTTTTSLEAASVATTTTSSSKNTCHHLNRHRLSARPGASSRLPARVRAKPGAWLRAIASAQKCRHKRATTRTTTATSKIGMHYAHGPIVGCCSCCGRWSRVLSPALSRNKHNNNTGNIAGSSRPSVDWAPWAAGEACNPNETPVEKVTAADVTQNKSTVILISDESDAASAATTTILVKKRPETTLKQTNNKSRSDGPRNEENCSLLAYRRRVNDNDGSKLQINNRERCNETQAICEQSLINTEKTTENTDRSNSVDGIVVVVNAQLTKQTRRKQKAQATKQIQKQLQQQHDRNLELEVNENKIGIHLNHSCKHEDNDEHEQTRSSNLIYGTQNVTSSCNNYRPTLRRRRYVNEIDPIPAKITQPPTTTTTTTTTRARNTPTDDICPSLAILSKLNLVISQSHSVCGDDEFISRSGDGRVCKPIAGANASLANDDDSSMLTKCNCARLGQTLSRQHRQSAEANGCKTTTTTTRPRAVSLQCIAPMSIGKWLHPLKIFACHISKLLALGALLMLVGSLASGGPRGYRKMSMFASASSQMELGASVDHRATRQSESASTNGNSNNNNNNNEDGDELSRAIWATMSTQSSLASTPTGTTVGSIDGAIDDQWLANSSSSSSSSGSLITPMLGGFGSDMQQQQQQQQGQQQQQQQQLSDLESVFDEVLNFGRIFLMGAIIVGDICGNSLVILSVCRHSKLRVTTNWFVVSLACADILVALFAMTFNASVIISGRWLFKPWVCDFWNSCDVLASTASILHLCCISIDRYIAIMRPLDYPMKITTRRVMWALCAVWVSSALLSYIPIFTGIYTTSEHTQWLQENPDQCEFVVNRVYAIVSSSISFWIPCCIMVFTYYRIYREATRQEKFIYKTQNLAPAVNHHHQQQHNSNQNSAHLRNKRNRSKSLASSVPRLHQQQQQHQQHHHQAPAKLRPNHDLLPIAAAAAVVTTDLSEKSKVVGAGESDPLTGSAIDLNNNNTTANANNNNNNNGKEVASAGSQPSVAMRPQTTVATTTTSTKTTTAQQQQQQQQTADDDDDRDSGQSTPTKRSISKMKREHKAAKTLGIIMGVFILCWLPFFSWYTPQHICGHACEGMVPRQVVTLLFWIGYFNSTLNPIIYAYFNHEFRDAFKKTLQWIFCCCQDLKCLRVSRPNDSQHYNCTYRSTQEIGLVSS